jgi:hypothetical protein
MGASLSGGYSSKQTSATSTGTSSGTQANTYGAPQTALQNRLGSSLASNLAASDAGTLSPGVAAQKTAAADSINKTSGGLLDRVNQFLAARGFGKSGTTGKATLQSELGRESQLAGNEANFAQVQQGVNSQNLMAALNYAFQSLGLTQNLSESGTSTGSSSGWGIGADVGAGFPSIAGKL